MLAVLGFLGYLGLLSFSGFSGFSLLTAEVSADTVPALSVGAEPGLECPDAAAVERALADTGGPRVVPAGEDGPVWALLLARAPDGVRVSLRDPAGVTQLSRALATHPSRCGTAAEATAIIVERYFREVAWMPDAPPAPPDRASPPTATATPDAESAAGSMFSLPPRLIVGVGPAYWTRPGGPSVLLDGRVRLFGPVCAGAGVLLLPFQTDQTLGAAGGRARLSGVPVIMRVATAGTRGRLSGTAGVETLLTFEQGESRDIAGPATARRTVLAVGAGVGAALAFGSRLRAAADIGGYRGVLGRSFQIEGIAGSVLEPPPWQAVFGMRLEWIMFP